MEPMYTPIPTSNNSDSIMPLLVGGAVIAGAMYWNNGRQMAIVDEKLAGLEGRVNDKLTKISEQVTGLSSDLAKGMSEMSKEFHSSLETSNALLRATVGSSIKEALASAIPA